MALLVNGQASLGGMGLCRRSCCERTGRGRQGKCSGALNWVRRRWDKKIGSASAWARFLIFFRQRGHRQAWLGGLRRTVGRTFRTGSASTWTRFLIVGKFWQDWHGGLEREAPEAGAILFASSIKDAVAIQMGDQDSMLGEDNLAAEIGKGAQADEGMGEGGHNMPLHSCWWEGRGRG